MQWLILITAGVFEIGFAIGLKYSHGLTKPLATTLSAISVLISMGLLAIALKHLPVGTAYAVWTGIGTVGTALLGLVLFDEPATIWRMVFITMIVAGIVGLRVVTP